MGWLDPNTWKPIADLVQDWKAIAGGVTAVIAGGVWLWRPISNLFARSSRRDSPKPAERPLRFVQTDRASFWGPLARGKEPGTNVTGQWLVTNTSDKPIVLVTARIDGQTAENTVVSVEGTRGGFSSRYFIPAHQIRTVSVNFVFFPPIASGNDPLVVDLIFTDNYEDEHRVRSATFKPVHRV